MLTEKKYIARAVIIACCVGLNACASSPEFGGILDDITDGVLGDSELGVRLKQGIETPVASGMAWTSPYTIKRSLGSRYSLYSPRIKKPIVLTRGSKLEKLRSFRTDKMTTDIYSSPTAECPNRYVAITGTKNRIRSNGFGCTSSLKFEEGSSNDVYATEAYPPGDVTPLAYRITDYKVSDPEVLTRYRSHPEYNTYRYGGATRDRTVASPPTTRSRGNPSTVSRKPKATKTASAGASPPLVTRRLPPAEKVILPGEIEERDPETTKSTVDLGI